MQSYSLSRALQQPEVFAQQLLDLHKRTYPLYWNWIDDVVNYAVLEDQLFTVFGWYLQIKRSFTRKDQEKFNIPPDAFRRGLKQLENSGLIQVERRVGHPSLITILKN